MNTRSPARWLVLTALSTLLCNGCAALHPVSGIPVNQVPAECRAEPRSGKVPIDLSRLRQTPPAEYRVDAGDLLGVFVEGILAKPGEMPPVTIPNNTQSTPALGFPILVQDDGTITLPGFPELDVRGMTLREIRERIRKAYTDENPLFQKDANQEPLILVSLQRKRTYRVLVIRQESDLTSYGSGAPSQIDLNVLRRGTGQVVSLPAYENDVLHALTQTGGLPSSKAENAVYIIRRRPQTVEQQPVETPLPLSGPSVIPQSQPVPYASAPVSHVGHSTPRGYHLPQPTFPSPPPASNIPFGPSANPYNSYRGHVPQTGGISHQSISRAGHTIRGQSPDWGQTVNQMPSELFLDGYGLDNPQIIRIPMRVYPGEHLPFTEADIILQDGDIAFVESRETEFFFTGGLLGGGQYVLPQNYDLDLLEAMSIVQSRVNTSFNSNTRAIGGVSALNHDVTVGASKVIILRKAPNGGEIKIEVDLYDAVHDPSERIIIKPGDYVMLQYTRFEAVAAFFERYILEGAVIGAASSLVFGNN